MKVDWKNTMYPHAWIGSITRFQEMAHDAGYMFIAWNGRLYSVSDLTDWGAYTE